MAQAGRASLHDVLRASCECARRVVHRMVWFVMRLAGRSLHSTAALPKQ